MKKRLFRWHDLPIWLQIFGVLILADAWVLGGCDRLMGVQREPVLVIGLEERMYSAPKDLKFDMQNAREILEEAIDKSQRLRLTEERSDRVYRAEFSIIEASENEIEYARQENATGIVRTVQVELVLSRWMDEGQPNKLIAVGRSMQNQPEKRVGRQEGFILVLEQAINQSVEYVDLQLLTRDIPLQELEALLSKGDSKERLYVLRALRSRQDAGALVSKVIDMLSDPDPDIAMESVGVLVAQKDPRAVKPLIRMSRRRDQLFLLQIITALSEIQGVEARGYLYTLSVGHTSPVIRNRAKEALGRFVTSQELIKTSAAPTSDVKLYQ